MTSHGSSIRIGADIGGTFTDVLVVSDQGQVWSRKVPSTPPNYEEAVLCTVEQLLGEIGRGGDAVSEVAHGTTVATNAVLERRGARTALVTTKGFRDVLELRRIRAPQLYDLFFDKSSSLIDRHLRFELDERISATGEVLVAPSDEQLQRTADQLIEHEVESVAVCLLHSYAYPEHERRLGAFLRAAIPNLPVSLSCEVLRERREYERTATTAVNAYVRPVMDQYLRSLRSGLAELEISGPLLIMQSAGGLTPEEDAARRPVYALESGPAAGVLGALYMARDLGVDNIVTFDMGGTTAKASLIEGGEIAYSQEYEVGSTLSAVNRLVGGAGELIRAATIDIAEVSAGGGSIAYLDRARGLRVGPRSAGSIPGPVCYQRGGTEPTLTDANVVLGYIRSGQLADGQVSIDEEAARKSIHDAIAKPLGIDLLEAAEGIHRIANARTMRALREVSTQRGRDPRQFSLLAFGGSGPIHAANLSIELRTQQVIIPAMPGLFSAVGLLCSGVEHHAVRSCRLSGQAMCAAPISELQDEMRTEMFAQFGREGYSSDQITWITSADMRFRGQTSEIRIRVEDEPISPATVERLCTAFGDEHERTYGHRSDPHNPLEVVAVRLIGRAGAFEGTLRIEPSPPSIRGSSSRDAYFGSQWGQVNTPVIDRRDLNEATRGPLLIDEYDTTIVIPPMMTANVDMKGNVIMSND